MAVRIGVTLLCVASQVEVVSTNMISPADDSAWALVIIGVDTRTTQGLSFLMTIWVPPVKIVIKSVIQNVNAAGKA